jgi:hypothetical protein
VAAVVLSGNGCGQTAGPPVTKTNDKPSVKATSNRSASDVIVGEPIRHANLTIFPVSTRTPKTDDRFITLDEGLKAGTVEVLEIGAARDSAAANVAPATDDPFSPPAANGPNAASASSLNDSANSLQDVFVRLSGQAGADVNHLLVTNHSTKSLYLMPGEIIIGGQQDRTIAQEYVIAPAKEPTPIEVFCVEHDRWQGRSPAETAMIVEGANSSLTLESTNSYAGFASIARGGIAVHQPKAEDLARQAATGGKFIGSVGSVSKGARLAVQGNKDQTIVWDAVALEIQKSGVNGGDGAFTENYAEPEAVNRLEPYLAALLKPVIDRQNVVGVIVAIDGKMETLDIFESTPLFRRMWPKLLKSYALDAVNAGEKDSKDCEIADAEHFLSEALTAKGDQTASNGNVATTTRCMNHLVCFCARDSRRAAAEKPDTFAAPGGLGGFSGAIHASGFSK